MDLLTPTYRDRFYGRSNTARHAAPWRCAITQYPALYLRNLRFLPWQSLFFAVLRWTARFICISEVVFLLHEIQQALGFDHCNVARDPTSDVNVCLRLFAVTARSFPPFGRPGANSACFHLSTVSTSERNLSGNLFALA
jgi:hypothetical protein